MTAIQRRRLTRVRYRQLHVSPRFLVKKEFEAEWMNSNTVVMNFPIHAVQPIPEPQITLRPWWQGRLA